MAGTDGADGFIAPFLKLCTDTGRLFATFDGTPITFGQLERWSAAIAAAFGKRGLSPGDRVAVMLRNSPAAIAVVLGLARARLIWVPVNVQQRGEGLRYILEHSEPSLLIAEKDLLQTVAESGARIPDRIVSAASGEAEPDLSLQSILRQAVSFSDILPGPDDIFAISYTSGTTGRPKGVMVSHRMLRLAGEAVALAGAIEDGDILFHWEPIYHIGGSQMLVLPLIRRCHLAMVGRFSASQFWHEVRAARASHIHYLGGVLQILLKQPVDALDRGHGVRIAWGGGCPATIWREAEERFGFTLRECYGMTEAASITTINADGIIGSVGKPVPWFGVTVVDAAGAPVSAGEKGEIAVTSKLPGVVTRGYYHDVENTSRLLRDGVLHTGDLGTLDPDGNLRFLGRMTDSLRCRGENVSAWEIEHVVAAFPSVESCAVIGVPAEFGEQDIKLFVQPKAGQSIDPPTLCAWLSSRLAPYQVPRYIAVASDFERTPSERIMKHRLSPSTGDSWDSQKDALARAAAVRQADQ